MSCIWEVTNLIQATTFSFTVLLCGYHDKVKMLKYNIPLGHIALLNNDMQLKSDEKKINDNSNIGQNILYLITCVTYASEQRVKTVSIHLINVAFNSWIIVYHFKEKYAFSLHLFMEVFNSYKILKKQFPRYTKWNSLSSQFIRVYAAFINPDSIAIEIIPYTCTTN